MMDAWKNLLKALEIIRYLCLYVELSLEVSFYLLFDVDIVVQSIVL